MELSFLGKQAFLALLDPSMLSRIAGDSTSFNQSNDLILRKPNAAAKRVASPRLFLRCQKCSNLALIKFLRKRQFAFLGCSLDSKKTQWMFRTICRQCTQATPAPVDLLSCAQNENFLSIDQLVLELSMECALVSLCDGSGFFLNVKGKNSNTRKTKRFSV